MFNPYFQFASSSSGTTPMWNFVVPQSSILVIKSIDVWASNTLSTTNVSFGLFLNGTPYGQFGLIPLFPGVAAVNSRSFNDQTFRFGPNDVVSMVAVNTDGGSYELASSAQGWYYSVNVQKKYQ